MTVEMARTLLLWCTLINYATLLIWFLLYVLAHGWLCRVWGKCFHLPAEQLDQLNFGGMMLYKLGIVLFNLAPCVALYMVR
jgi:hypothetical protein